MFFVFKVSKLIEIYAKTKITSQYASGWDLLHRNFQALTMTRCRTLSRHFPFCRLPWRKIGPVVWWPPWGSISWCLHRLKFRAPHWDCLHPQSHPPCLPLQPQSFLWPRQLLWLQRPRPLWRCLALQNLLPQPRPPQSLLPPPQSLLPQPHPPQGLSQPRPPESLLPQPRPPQCRIQLSLKLKWQWMMWTAQLIVRRTPDSRGRWLLLVKTFPTPTSFGMEVDRSTS